MEGGGFNFADYPVIVGIDFGKEPCKQQPWG